MKRALLVVVASVLVFAAAAVSLRAAARDVGTGYELENVQVMDPKTRLADARKFMITFNEALGVTCRDCHDLRHFAGDEKPLKLAAREMMKMQREINESWFPEQGEVVTCWTCHRGQRIPPQDSGFTSLLSDAAVDSAATAGEDPPPPAPEGR